METIIYGIPHTWDNMKIGRYAMPLELVQRIIREDEKIGSDFELKSASVEVVGVLRNSASVEKLLVKQGSKFLYVNLEYYLNCFEGNREVISCAHLFPKISEAGAALIRLLDGSDSGESEISTDQLAKVVSSEEVKETERPLISHSPYASPSVTKIILTYDSGEKQTAYYTSVGYFEGYQFDLFASKRSAYKDFYDGLQALAKHDWTETECWECGATFDQPGFVEPGQMGCTRCN